MAFFYAVIVRLVALFIGKIMFRVARLGKLLPVSHMLLHFISPFSLAFYYHAYFDQQPFSYAIENLVKFIIPSQTRQNNAPKLI